MMIYLLETAVSTTENRLFCAVEVDALLLFLLPSGVKIPSSRGLITKLKVERKAEAVTARR